MTDRPHFAHIHPPWKKRQFRGCSTDLRMFYQKGLEVCYCLWGVPSRPSPGTYPGPSRSHPGSEVVPSRFAMCFVLQCFGPIQVPRWGPSRPVLVPSCSRAFLTGSGLDGQKQTSWPLPILLVCTFFLHFGPFFLGGGGTPRLF